MNEKQAMRNRVMTRLRALSPKEREMESMLATQNAAIIKEVENAKSVMLFAPMADEPDIWPLIDLLLARRRTVVLPAVSGGVIVPCEYRGDDILVSSSYGALEPSTQYAVDASIIELVLVPGVAFDIKGHRLGHGMGHYDRFLAPLNCIKIGLCYEVQMEQAVPFEPHDVTMDAVCTDTRLILCNKRVTPLHVNKPV